MYFITYNEEQYYRNSPKDSDTDKIISVGDVRIFMGIEN